MTNLNMRRILKTPTLRMQAGGMLASPTPESEAAAKAAGAANMAGFARQSAALTADSGTPTAPAETGGNGVVGGAQMLSSYTPLAMPKIGMKAGGSYEDGRGGVVPGKPRGDTHNALYEGGETVVSNDVQEDNPGLKETLASLREETLTRRGVTVAEADAKALGYDHGSQGGEDGQAQTLRGGVQGRGERLAGVGGADNQARGSSSDHLRDPRQVTLRANTGFGLEPYVNHRAPNPAPAQAPPYLKELGYDRPVTGTAVATRPAEPYKPNFTRPNSTPQAGVMDSVLDAGMAADARANAAARADARAAAGAAGTAPSATVPPPTSAAPSTPKPTLSAGMAAQEGAVGKALYAGGRALAPIAKIARALAPIAKIARVAGPLAQAYGTVESFNDYKLNDPGVDSSAMGTWQALQRDRANKVDNSAPEMRKSLVKGAQEAAMDVGSGLAKTLDLAGYLPGVEHGFASKAYDKGLRGLYGDRLAPHGSQAAATGAPNTQAGALPDAGRGQGWDPRRLDANGGRGDMPAAADPRRLDMDPGRASLGASRDFTNELSGRPGGRMQALPSDLREGVVHKTVDAQGRVTYSGRNVGQQADGSTQMVDGTGRNMKMRGSLEVASGPVTMGGGGYAVTAADPKATPEMRAARQEATSASLRNPDGTKWSANDNATMAANLRDGNDPYAGTSRAPKADPNDISQPMSKGKRNALVAQNAVNATLKGQDNQLKIAMAPIEQAAKLRAYSASVFKAAGGDNAKAATMMQQAGFDPKQFLDVQKSQLDNVTSEQAQMKAARESGKDRFKGHFVTKGKDGDVRDDLAEARAESVLNQITKGTYSQMGETAQQANHKDAIDLVNMFSQVQTPKLRGFEKAGNQLGLVNDPVKNSEMPDFKGGTATRRGVGMTYGADSGTWDVTDSKGKVHNFSNLEKSQIKLLQKMGVTVPNEK